MTTDDLDPLRHDLDALLAELAAAGADVRKPTKIRCPFHDDKTPSADVRQGDDGVFRFRCYSASCGFHGDIFDVRAKAQKRPLADVLKEAHGATPPAGGNWRGKATMPKPARQDKPPVVFATFDDAVAEGERRTGGKYAAHWIYPADVLRVVRFDLPGVDPDTGKPKKTFRPIRPVLGGWELTDPPGLLPLYHADELPADEVVPVCEGEKAADAARECGFAAVTSAHGSGSAERSDWQPLAGHRVVVLPDHDASGAKSAADVAGILTRLTPPADVRIVDLPGLRPSDDFVEWVSADGPMGDKSAEEIKTAVLALAEACPLWTPPADAPAEHAPAAEQVSIILPAFESADTFCAKYPDLRPAVIEGLLRRTEVGNLISAPKLRKSYTLAGLGICVSVGLDWLGFKTRTGKTLLMDLELHRETLAHRLPAVLAAYGLTRKDVAGRLYVDSLRGRRGVDIYTMAPYFKALEGAGFDLLIVDPLYKLLPAKGDENSNIEMANVYAALGQYAEQANAAMIVCHHLTKGSQADRSVTDLGAGGGSQSRAADSHLALREHAEPNAAVLGGVLRSFAPFEPIALRWTYPRWELAPDLDPLELKRPERRRQPKPKDDAPAEPPKPSFDVAAFAETCLKPEPQARAAIIDAALTAGAANPNQAEALLTRAEGRGLAHRWKMPKDKRVFFASRPQPMLTGSNE